MDEELYSRLRNATKLGNHVEVAQCLQEGANIHHPLDDGLNGIPLHVAVEKGHESVVRVFIDYGVYLETEDKNGWTALHCAVGKGKNNMVKLLLSSGANIEAKTKKLWTPLHFATWHNEKSSLITLLTHGANPEARREDGYTALHYAAEAGSEEIVRILLDYGADLEARVEDSQKTALHLAAEKGNDRVVKVLIERGADVQARDGSDKTALQLAAESTYCGNVRKQYISSIFARHHRSTTYSNISGSIPKVPSMSGLASMKPVWKYQTCKC